MTNLRRTTALLVSAAVVTVILPATAQLATTTPVHAQTAQPPHAQVDAPVPEIDWSECGDGLQCATVRVPLDYDEPHGPTTELALAKHPARDDDGRVATVFVNPGGPGDSAVDQLPWYVDNLPETTLDRFDVIGVDPRGVGGSSPLTCQPDGGAHEPPRSSFPITRRQITAKLSYDEHVRRSCSSGANRIIDHMTTADTARDMDLIRQAVGNEKLTYYGISYGSLVGATYAAMFPDRIRAMVLDGVMDPIGYTTGQREGKAIRPVTSRWGSAEGTWKVLTEAFAECNRVGPQRCPIAGDAHRKWQRIMDRLRRGPVMVAGERLHYQDVVVRAGGALTGVSSYRALMRYIGATYDALFGSGPRSRSAAALRHVRLGDRIAPRASASGPLEPVTEGVICADSINPSNPRAWVKAGVRADRRAPWFGRFWTWRSSVCAGWPGSSADAYRGPFATSTSAPVLLVAHLRDPSTPISGARVVNTLLEDSRLLVLDGWGHGALGESACIGRYVEEYLASSSLPSPGTVCGQDERPFPRHR